MRNRVREGGKPLNCENIVPAKKDTKEEILQKLDHNRRKKGSGGRECLTFAKVLDLLFSSVMVGGCAICQMKHIYVQRQFEICSSSCRHG